MNDPFSGSSPPRVWRQDEGAMAAGVCAGLAEDLDLPLPLVRIVALLFLILPTGLAYLALALLLRRRQPRHPGRTGWTPSYRTAAGQDGGRRGGGRSAPMPDRPLPVREGWALLRHRFETLEPRLGRIEAFVTAPDFELHRGFRRMGE